MKKLTLTLIAIISLCSTNFSRGADRYVTLKVNAASNTASVNIAANEVAELIYVNKGVENGITITIGGDAMGISSNNGGPTDWWFKNKGPAKLMVAGPATITHTFQSNPNFATIKISPNPNIGGVGQ